MYIHPNIWLFKQDLTVTQAGLEHMAVLLLHTSQVLGLQTWVTMPGKCEYMLRVGKKSTRCRGRRRSNTHAGYLHKAKCTYRKKILPHSLRWHLVPLSYDKLRQGRKVPALEEACWSQHPGVLQGAEQSPSLLTGAGAGLARSWLICHPLLNASKTNWADLR